MNWYLLYNIALGFGLLIALAWAFDARRLMSRASRLVEMREYDGPPTEEIELPATMRIGPAIMEDFGLGKPVPPMAYKTPPPVLEPRRSRDKWH